MLHRTRTRTSTRPGARARAPSRARARRGALKLSQLRLIYACLSVPPHIQVSLARPLGSHRSSVSLPGQACAVCVRAPWPSAALARSLDSVSGPLASCLSRTTRAAPTRQRSGRTAGSTSPSDSGSAYGPSLRQNASAWNSVGTPQVDSRTQAAQLCRLGKPRTCARASCQAKC